MNIYEKLGIIQSKLKAPKGQYNSFGKYKYRSCEDILEAVKPLQLSLVADNYIESSYKARTLASYVQALNGLLTAQKSYKEENIGE